MARKAFYSFHFDNDHWRANQVRNIGIVEGNQPVSSNDWEAVKRGGDAAIEKWINGQMYGRGVTIVLVGQDTANRKWINYEIIKSWNDRMGVLGIRINNLLNSKNLKGLPGKNPFDSINLHSGDKLSTKVKLYDPPYAESKNVYSYICDNLSAWVEESIRIRTG